MVNLLIRKNFSASKLKQCYLQSVAVKRRRIKFGDATLFFLGLSYFSFLKKLGDESKFAAISNQKRAILLEHVNSAFEEIKRKTRVRRRQRTLDDMLKKRRG